MKLVIFDFDGVLIDSKRAYVHAIDEALGHKIPKSRIESSIGPVLIEVITGLLGLPASSKQVQKAVKKVNKTVMLLDKVKQVPADALADIKKGCKIAIVTNSKLAFVKKCFQRFGVRVKWDAMATADDHFNFKEDALKSLMQRFSAGPYETLYIGDMVRDIEVAKNVGCKSAAIFNRASWEYPNLGKIKKAKPDFIVKSLKEIAGLLEYV